MTNCRRVAGSPDREAADGRVQAEQFCRVRRHGYHGLNDRKPTLAKGYPFDASNRTYLELDIMANQPSYLDIWATVLSAIRSRLSDAKREYGIDAQARFLEPVPLQILAKSESRAGNTSR